MKIPKLHNTRAEKQWEVVSAFVDFKDKTVIDLGCGGGDILFRIADAGAKSALGIDSYADLIQLNREKSNYPNLNFVHEDIETFIRINDGKYDVSICFSVLPYLDDPEELLFWMRDHSAISLIECQYNGDGPGLEKIDDDTVMRNWLAGIGFSRIGKIGYTHVKGRDKTRSIWLCYA